MKTKPVSLIVLAALICGVQLVNAQSQTNLVTKAITSNSAGKVKLGMTVAEMRRTVAPMKVKRTSDGEGIALIAVTQGRKTVMTVYAGEENPNARINEKARLEQIEVWDTSYSTAGGVHPGMLLRDVERKLGKLVKIVRSEIEAREYAEFTNQPKGIDIRVSGSEEAGSYPPGESTTSKYRDDARIFSILVTGRDNSVTAGTTSTKGTSENNGGQFTSVYSSLGAGCKTQSSKQGGHSSTWCKAPGGYRVHIFDSATTLEFVVENDADKFSLRLPSQALDYDQKTRQLEWRMANGKPFAVIMRVNTYRLGSDGLIAYPTTSTGEFLVVKGLKSLESLDERIDAKSPYANIRARDFADNAFNSDTSKATRITFKGNAISVQAPGTFTAFHQHVHFVVRAEKGRRMIVNIVPVSSGLATAGVVTGPSGQSDGQPGGIVFDDTITATGDYQIEVSQRPTEFSLPAQFIVEVIQLPDFLNH